MEFLNCGNSEVVDFLTSLLRCQIAYLQICYGI